MHDIQQILSCLRKKAFKMFCFDSIFVLNVNQWKRIYYLWRSRQHSSWRRYPGVAPWSFGFVPLSESFPSPDQKWAPDSTTQQSSAESPQILRSRLHSVQRGNESYFLFKPLQFCHRTFYCLRRTCPHRPVLSSSWERKTKNELRETDSGANICFKRFSMWDL